MTDKYTELAREWLDGYEPVFGYDHNDAEIYALATLLRRVAREQIEEDADWMLHDISCQCTDGYTSRDLIDPSCYYHDVLGLSDALRSRAKELED